MIIFCDVLPKTLDIRYLDISKAQNTSDHPFSIHHKTYAPRTDGKQADHGG